MNLENKVTGFQFEPEWNISNHEGFYQGSSDEGDAIERDMFFDTDIWYKCRNCSTMKTEKECLCCQELETVCNLNLLRIFVLNEASNSFIEINS